jgi:pimeloyl-ACP methyl ester carboxylesterase
MRGWGNSDSEQRSVMGTLDRERLDRAADIGGAEVTAVDQLDAMGFDDDLIDPASELNQKQGGTNLCSSVLPSVEYIDVPTMLVQYRNDPMLNRDAIDQYFESLTDEKEMVWLDLEPARLAPYDHFNNHPDNMVSFFDAHI